MKTTRLFTLLAIVFSIIGLSNLSAQKFVLPTPDHPPFWPLSTQTTSTSTADQPAVQDPGDSAGPLGLNKDQLLSLGCRMWNNCAGGTVDGLTKWDGSDADHQFMYLGIAQNIWLPEGSSSMFQADWSTVAQRLQELGCKIKPWMLKDCPWSSKEEFDADFNGKKMSWLRTHLSKEKFVRAQAFCIAERLQRAMDPSSPGSLLTGLTADQSALVQENFDLVAHCSNPSGVYALIDYVNFKGEGRLGGTEEFNGQGWGLLQVLLNMKTPEEGANDATIMNAFVEGAKVTLNNRIINHKIQDPNNNDAQYWDMWVAHLSDYLLTNAEVTARGLDQAPVAPSADASNK
ncbi:MAG: hypothetical protein K2W97_08940 [Chthoniobacterales bacterium]|nr:hypothetical protein [Chthoniobacterales bacterium]